MQLLAKYRLSFDIAIEPEKLSDIVSLARKVPETIFILNHCGGHNMLTKKNSDQQLKWKNNISELSKLSNVVMKISGLYNVAEKNDTWTLESHISAIKFI